MNEPTDKLAFELYTYLWNADEHYSGIRLLFNIDYTLDREDSYKCYCLGTISPTEQKVYEHNKHILPTYIKYAEEKLLKIKELLQPYDTAGIQMELR